MFEKVIKRSSQLVSTQVTIMTLGVLTTFMTMSLCLVETLVLEVATRKHLLIYPHLSLMFLHTIRFSVPTWKIYES